MNYGELQKCLDDGAILLYRYSTDRKIEMISASNNGYAYFYNGDKQLFSYNLQNIFEKFNKDAFELIKAKKEVIPNYKQLALFD